MPESENTEQPTDHSSIMPPSGEAPVIAFRAHKIFSLRFLRHLTIITATFVLLVFCLASPERLLHAQFLEFMGVYLTMVIMLFTGWRLFLKYKGGVKPIQFEADHLLLPPHIHSFRLNRLAYKDILSVTRRGKGQAGLAIEGRKGSFIYPLLEFTDADAWNKLTSELHRRIARLPKGLSQLQSMEIQQSRTEFLTRTRPHATWIIGILITAIFIFQTLWTPDDPLSLIDMGANAGALTFSGEWYRLVSANLVHADAMHIFTNLILLVILSPLAERILGLKRYLVLVLSTGILSQLASAWWNYHNPATASAFSVGISGTLFGILGALAVLNYRFRGQLPGGFKLAARFWWIMIALFIITPLITPNVDSSAHAGGLIAGAVIGWLLCRTQQELTAPTQADWQFNAALAALSAVWGASVIIVAAHIISPAARVGDHAKLVTALLDNRPNLILDNSLAFAVASDPLADDAQLHDALKLAQRTSKYKANVPPEDIDAYNDTLATLYYRTGDPDDAIATELTLRTLESTKMSQLARFLDRYRAVHGTPQLPEDSRAALPEVTLTQLPWQWSLNVNAPQALPHGAVLYLNVHMGKRLVGMMVVHLPATTKPGQYANLLISPPDDITSITLTPVKFDSAGCDCKGTNPSVRFFRMDKDIAKMP